MSDASELNKAIVAHGAWKARLRDAIDTGRSDFTPEIAAADGECAFGKWLKTLPVADRSTEHFQKIAPLHAKFHQEASKVLRMAISGHKNEAEDALRNIKSEFVTTSASLVNAITEWKSKCK